MKTLLVLLALTVSNLTFAQNGCGGIPPKEDKPIVVPHAPAPTPPKAPSAPRPHTVG